jgi:hypothetical protein
VDKNPVDTHRSAVYRSSLDLEARQLGKSQWGSLSSIKLTDSHIWLWVWRCGLAVSWEGRNPFEKGEVKFDSFSSRGQGPNFHFSGFPNPSQAPS